MTKTLVQVYACWDPARCPVGTVMRQDQDHAWHVTRIGSVFGQRTRWHGVEPVRQTYRYFTLEVRGQD